MESKYAIQLVIPMSGQGTRYQKAGYQDPKPLIQVNGTPMVKRLLDTFPLDWPTTFVIAENHFETALPKRLEEWRPQGKILKVPVHTKGPGRAIEAAIPHLDPQSPVLVSYCDYGQSWDPRAFENFVRSSGCDATVLCYRGFHAHYLNPVMYAYCRLKGERVLEIKEKACFTKDREQEFASSGAYYFRSAKLLQQALSHQVQKDLSLGGEFYTSLTVQALIEQNPAADVRVFEIPHFYQWGTPEDLKEFEYWERTYHHWNRELGQNGKVSQVLMPMAGEGSRFKRWSSRPKPLIRINGKPMYQRALSTLPDADHSVFVTRDDFKAEFEKGADGYGRPYQNLSLQTTPSGQALSVEAGLMGLKPDGDVIVSSCDHGAVLPVGTWQAFRSNPKCEAAIFTVRGYPGASRTPKSYAYVKSKAESVAFPCVESVSVKQALSDSPQKDAVLVGTFWFKDKSILSRGIEWLKEKDIRVNGELYLDSIFEGLMDLGVTVREIPLAGYLCWGDPEAFLETVYWEEVFLGRRLVPRTRQDFFEA